MKSEREKEEEQTKKWNRREEKSSGEHEIGIVLSFVSPDQPRRAGLGVNVRTRVLLLGVVDATVSASVLAVVETSEDDQDEDDEERGKGDPRKNHCKSQLNCLQRAGPSRECPRHS